MNAGILVLSCYLLGAIPAGYLLVRLVKGKDIRVEGSGNIGATNVLRTTGRAAGIATLLFDIGKGALAVGLGRMVEWQWPPALSEWAPPDTAPVFGALALLAVVTGHVFPVTLGFRGGKGVACAVGAALVHQPLAAIGALAILFVAVAWTRWVSFGSILFAIAFPIFCIPGPDAALSIALLAAASILIVARHSGNLSRLFAGTEPRLGAR
jgi:glycerol-3-phosphate acyltransferase PlsY